MPLDPITRTEQFYSRIAGDGGKVLEPITRKEHFLARIAGDANAKVLEPKTRTEHFLQQIIDSGSGGGDITVEALSVTANGTYTAPPGKAYSPVTVAVKDDTVINALIDRSITEIESGVTSIGVAAFKNCDSLESVRFPSATTIYSEAFYHTSIKEVSVVEFPRVSTIHNNAFTATNTIRRVFMPNASAAQMSFSSCGNLQNAVIMRIAGNMCFSGCGKLEAVDIASGNILPQSFNICAMLNIVVLRGTNLSPLANQNAFTGTPFASGGSGGTIYIPKSLYDQLGTGSANDYKAATNWSVIDSYGTITWAPIEGSYYETHYADGTLIPTA